uniref:Uncharacterized protein n=1 Tax=Polytomella parva TaxID=51329 RepID=A0A7S0UP06_9CHLO|mmetsp:Transcript_1075/g.1546  ORF Transcript_1075/g.1546 Transcript_1075/m.1546 type:complete len:511 (+) Transcript_1075:97-1629(+)
MVTVQEAAEERIDKATSLVLHSKGVRDLSGLEQCVNLKSLDVSFNNISSTGPVDCISLKELKLCANAISSVTGLQGLSNLVSLDLSSNRLEDVSGLQYLRSLRSLDLSYNGLTDFSSLGRTTNLESLKATANRLTSLRGLEPCASLLFLDVSANRLSTLGSSLVRCNRLTELVASENELNSVGGFKICGGSLEILDLSRNKITNLTGLPPDMPMLSEMLMAGNCLEYEAVKTIVAAAPNLEILDLGENKLFTSIGPDDTPEDDSFSNDPSLMRVPSLADSSNPPSSSSSLSKPRRISGTGATAPSSIARPPPSDSPALRKIPLGHGRTIALAPNGAFVRQKSVPSGPRSLGDEKKGEDKKKGGISRTSSSCGRDSERKQSNSGRSRDGPGGGGNGNDLDQDVKSNNNSAVTNNAKLATSNSIPLPTQSSTASTPRSSRKPSVPATPMERLEEMSKMLQSLQGLTCLAISESVTIPENFAEKVLTMIPQLQTCDQVERVAGGMPPPPPPAF